MSIFNNSVTCNNQVHCSRRAYVPHLAHRGLQCCFALSFFASNKNADEQHVSYSWLPVPLRMFAISQRRFHTYNCIEYKEISYFISIHNINVALPTITNVTIRPNRKNQFSSNLLSMAIPFQISLEYNFLWSDFFPAQRGQCV